MVKDDDQRDLSDKKAHHTAGKDMTVGVQSLDAASAAAGRVPVNSDRAVSDAVTQTVSGAVSDDTAQLMERKKGDEIFDADSTADAAVSCKGSNALSQVHTQMLQRKGSWLDHADSTADAAAIEKGSNAVSDSDTQMIKQKGDEMDSAANTADAAVTHKGSTSVSHIDTQMMKNKGNDITSADSAADGQRGSTAVSHTGAQVMGKKGNETDSAAIAVDAAVAQKGSDAVSQLDNRMMEKENGFEAKKVHRNIGAKVAKVNTEFGLIRHGSDGQGGTRVSQDKVEID